ncbi:phosphopantetheine adenylyltransferase [Candidatus Bathyarchaeota archaeon]|nr:phosphopantetheine adenylyltransferase [Candidatus Bathyarchaeota archaeon]
MVDRRLKLVTVGGTFDLLHKGHQALLEEAFKVADRVLIGLTTDEFARKLHDHYFDPFEKRYSALKKFLEEQGYSDRAEIIPINDPYGPTVENGEIEGIIVSEETEPRADEINRLRVERGLRPLLVFCIKMILAEDGKPISSTRIRRGEIDRYGRVIRRKPE